MPLTLSLLAAFVPLPAGSSQSRSRTLRVEASSYQYTPALLEVNPGDLVTIELVSTDVVHGLYVDGYDLSLSADPGQTARLTFSADRPGAFRLRCSVTCGPLHPFMIGRLRVGRDWLPWRAAVVSAMILAFVMLRRMPG